MPEATKQRWRQHIEAMSIDTMRDVLIIFHLSEIFQDNTLADRAYEALDHFSDTGVLYRFTPAVEHPDIRSTAIGLYVRGDRATAGSAALEYFQDSRGTWITAPDVKQGNAITAETLYLGAFLANSISSENIILR